MPQYPGPAKVRVELTVEELQANVQFLQDQLFRVKYIDPKIPGNRANHEHIKAAESALAVLQETLKIRSGPKPTRVDELESAKKADGPDFHRPVTASRARRA
jgi:hypothetical protein